MGKMAFYKQPDAMDCGPTCLRMLAKHYGKNISLQTLREKTQIGKEGVNMLGISDAAEAILKSKSIFPNPAKQTELGNIYLIVPFIATIHY